MLRSTDYENKAIEAPPAWYECPTKHRSMERCVTCGATPPRPDLLRGFAEGPDDAAAWGPWYGRNVIAPPPIDPPSPEFIAKDAELAAKYQAVTRRRDELTGRILRLQRSTFPKMRLDAATGQTLRDDQLVDELGNIVLRFGALARRGTTNAEIDDLLEQLERVEQEQADALMAINDHNRGPRDQTTKPHRRRLFGILGGPR